MLLNNAKPEQIKEWQAFLSNRNYLVKVTGVWDEATGNATKMLQAELGLRPDGLAGDLTINEAKRLGLTIQGDNLSPQGSDAHNAEMLSKVSPSLRDKVNVLLTIAKMEGYELRIVQGLRTFAEQDVLFNQWRDGKDNDGDGKIDEKDERVTPAAGGQSNHNYGLAVDVAFIVGGKVSWDDKLYFKLAPWCAKAGLGSGVNWKKKDKPHVELMNLPKWPILLALYKQGGIPAVWEKYR